MLTEFEIGRTYRVRSYESLKAEFGADKDGDIICGDLHMFKNVMSEELCGREFKREPENNHINAIVDCGERSWIVTAQMCELVENEVK